MKIIKQLIFFSMISILFFHISVFAAENKELNTHPKQNNQKKWRVAYYEGGPFANYPLTLIGIVNGLMEKGWVEPATIPEPEGIETNKLWEWLSLNLKSDYIEFVKDAHYSANWNKNSEKGINSHRNQLSRKIIKRFNSQKDIDLMIAMGTWAGQDLANDQHRVNTIVCSTSDPIAAKIIIDIANSGFDHIHARVDPRRYERQLRVFHDIIGFKKLGIAYGDTSSGRSYAAIATVEKIAKELGFEIIRCHVKAGVATIEEVGSLLSCYKKIAKNADAVYVTAQTGVNMNSIKDVVDIFNSHNLPSFAQNGIKYIKYGLLLSISQAGLKYVGTFYADTIAKVFNGAKPGQLDQLFEEPLSIAINIKTAEIIGYDPPVDVLAAADQIFQEIEIYKKK